MTTVIYPPSTPADRQAETERVIATVRATIAPADRAQALRDLAKGADGEPQLDALALYRAAAEIDRETIKLLEQWRTCAEDVAAVLLDHIGAKHLDEGIEILAERREQATKHRAEIARLRVVAIEQAGSALKAWCGVERIGRALGLPIPADVDAIVAAVEGRSLLAELRKRRQGAQGGDRHGETECPGCPECALDDECALTDEDPFGADDEPVPGSRPLTPEERESLRLTELDAREIGDHEAGDYAAAILAIDAREGEGR